MHVVIRQYNFVKLSSVHFHVGFAKNFPDPLFEGIGKESSRPFFGVYIVLFEVAQDLLDGIELRIHRQLKILNVAE